MVDKSVIDTLIAEAYAEGPEGMRRVAETMINRAALRGLTLDQVVRQPRQYTGFAHPGPDAVRAQQSPAARAAAEAALNLALQPGDPTGGADHYLNPDQASPSWASKIPSTGSYRNHQFFASRPIPPGEIANVVGTLTDTIPPRTVAPVTPSVDMRMMRSRPPTNLIADSFNGLPQRPGSALGDSLALSPVQANFPGAGQRDGGYSLSKRAVTLNSNPRDIALPRPRPLPQMSASDRARGSSPMNSLTVGGRAPIGLLAPGNLDLNKRAVLTDGVGGYRTENSISIGTDRGEVLIPTVVNGKQLSQTAAIDHYQKTGENLGTFKTPEAADRYAETLHERQGVKYAPTMAAPPALPRPRPQTAPPDLISMSRQRIASTNPTRLPPVPPSTLGRVSIPQSSIDRAPPRVAAAAPALPPRVTVATPFTTPQSQIDRGAPRAVAQSPIGQPPATRVVQSVPMPAIAPARLAIPQSYAGMEGNYQDPNRLAATPALPPALYGGVTGVTLPPTPAPRIARAPLPLPPYRDVAAELDVRPMPAMAPSTAKPWDGRRRYPGHDYPDRAGCACSNAAPRPWRPIR